MHKLQQVHEPFVVLVLISINVGIDDKISILWLLGLVRCNGQSASEFVADALIRFGAYATAVRWRSCGIDEVIRSIPHSILGSMQTSSTYGKESSCPSSIELKDWYFDAESTKHHFQAGISTNLFPLYKTSCAYIAPADKHWKMRACYCSCNCRDRSAEWLFSFLESLLEMPKICGAGVVVLLVLVECWDNEGDSASASLFMVLENVYCSCSRIERWL